VQAARHFVREVLRDEPSDVVGAAELMTSELATNCVLHAHTDFELTIERGAEIRVSVHDMSEGHPTPRSPTPAERTGRGLRIVEAMSHDWGSIPAQSGKTVWFTLSLRPFSAGEAATATSEASSSPAIPPRARARGDATGGRGQTRGYLGSRGHRRGRAAISV